MLTIYIYNNRDCLSPCKTYLIEYQSIWNYFS